MSSSPPRTVTRARLAEQAGATGLRQESCAQTLSQVEVFTDQLKTALVSPSLTIIIPGK